MLEVMRYLRDNGYKTFIVTGGGQDFVRICSQRVYGIPPEQIVGTAGGITYGYDKAGKPERIHLEIGVRSDIAFGNSTGDREMLEYTAAGLGVGLGLLVLHDDPAREYAYGPAEELPNTKVGAFTQALYDEAKGWNVISMKNDWKRIFSFEE
jgi:hypothetical protein